MLRAVAWAASTSGRRNVQKLDRRENSGPDRTFRDACDDDDTLQTDPVDGLFLGKRYLIHDRDPLFTTEFLNLLAEAGIESVKLPPRSPNLNAYAERFVGTIKESCLYRMILFGEGSLRKVIREFVAHYHLERNHQGLGNRLITAESSQPNPGPIRRRQRLGGMLNYYHRAA
jgi:hypothetical protein